MVKKYKGIEDLPGLYRIGFSNTLTDIFMCMIKIIGFITDFEKHVLKEDKNGKDYFNENEDIAVRLRTKGDTGYPYEVFHGENTSRLRDVENSGNVQTHYLFTGTFAEGCANEFLNEFDKIERLVKNIADKSKQEKWIAIKTLSVACKVAKRHYEIPRPIWNLDGIAETEPFKVKWAKVAEDKLKGRLASLEQQPSKRTTNESKYYPWEEMDEKQEFDVNLELYLKSERLIKVKGLI
jgi:hypothetical protein